MSEQDNKFIPKPGAVWDSGKVYVGIDAALNLHIHVNGVCYDNDEIADRFKQLEAEKQSAIEILKLVYLADNEGSSQFIELQQKNSDCLFDIMGWDGEVNLFADWQENKQ